MDLAQGPIPARQLQPPPPRFGQRVPEGLGPAQGLRHPVADLPAAQPGFLRLWIHRHDPAGTVTDQVDHRVGHPGPTAIALDLAEHHHLGALAQLLGPPGLVEEGERQVAGAVEQHHFHQRPPLAGAAGRAAADLAEDHGLAAFDQIGDVGLVGAVEVAPRVVREEIQHRVDAHGLQGGDMLRPDPPEAIDADLRQTRERGGRPGVGQGAGLGQGSTR